VRGRWIRISLLLAFSTVTHAETTPLGLAEVLDTASQRFPLIVAALRDQQEAESQQLSAEGGFDPTLRGSLTLEPVGGYPKQYGGLQIEQPTAYQGMSFFGGYKYGGGEFPIYKKELETNEVGEVRAGVRMPLLRDRALDRRRAGLKQAELGVAVAQWGVQQQKIDTQRLAALRYWDWVAAGLRLQIFQRWLALATDRDAGLAQRVKQGDLPEIDHVENQRAILQRQATVVAAERDVAQAGLELALYLEQAPAPSRLPTALPEVRLPTFAKLEDELQAARQRRPDLQRFEALKSRSQLEADLARNQQQPMLDVSIYGEKQPGDDDPKRGEAVLGASVMIDIPIFNRVQKGREQAATAVVGRLEEQQRLVQARIQLELESAVVNLKAIAERAGLAAQEVKVAQQLAAGELQRFDLGEGNLLLVNLREQALAEAALREADNLADFQRGLAQWQAVRGLE
jgi:outer membrane protein TolC